MTLLIEFAESYDIVTSDAFLTRFAYAEKELIIKKWFSILSEKGSIITTARIEDKINQNDAIKTDSKKVFYKREVELAVKDTLLVNQVDKVKNLAGEYISHIISIPFTSDGEIVDIFSKYSLKIQHGENVIVKGEVKQTKYYRLIAQKMSNNIDVRTDT